METGWEPLCRPGTVTLRTHAWPPDSSTETKASPALAPLEAGGRVALPLTCKASLSST